MLSSWPHYSNPPASNWDTDDEEPDGIADQCPRLGLNHVEAEAIRAEGFARDNPAVRAAPAWCVGIWSFFAEGQQTAHNQRMAWEWVAPVATASAGAVGVFFTWLSGKQGRDHAERTAREQLAQQRLLAQDARDQERLENAYLELLRMVEGLGQWVQHVYPSVDLGTPIKNPPTVDEQARTQALVNAFGSHRVRELLNEWRKFLRQAISLAVQIDSEEAQEIEGPSPENMTLETVPGLLPPKPSDVQNLKALLEKMRPDEREARQALTNQVAAELRHSVEQPAFD